MSAAPGPRVGPLFAYAEPWRLAPERASELAAEVDALTLFTLLIAAFFIALIASLLLYFGVKYRRRTPTQVGLTVARATAWLEVAWTIIPLGLVLYIFYAGAKVFFDLSVPPAGASRIFVVGRQWMWKFQHPDGRREIGELHVPVGQAIQLMMTSEDVIHSFYVPAFRIKTDVLPSGYTSIWFKADRTGTFTLFCAEYCGTEHSKMVGRVIVMDPHAYEGWLEGTKPARTTAESGAELFATRGCTTCHRPDSAARAPLLVGLLDKPVRLSDGQTIVSDANYIRESILQPAAKVVLGYPPIMPAYQGQFTEDELVALVAYLSAPPPGAIPEAGAQDGGAGSAEAGARETGANSGGREP